MTSKERILAVLDGRPPDHVPLTTWCFGFHPPKHLRWETNGHEVEYWYSKRLEHLHNLPRPWELQDDFKRALAWRSLGIDDVLDVSVPWSMDKDVRVTDRLIPVGVSGGDAQYPVMIRDYRTPSGSLTHAVRRTGNEGEGWPLQPDCVPLIEDYNIPRAVKHAVASPSDISALRHLFTPPDREQRTWFADRMKTVKTFADSEGFLVQAWSAFGMDAVVWFTGVEGAVLMAMDAPEVFHQLVDLIARTDYARTELAATTPGVDVICQRGWYSSTDFWSPALFNEMVFPHLSELTALAHRHGKKFGYVMTTGVEVLGPRLADAGVDLLYFVDPIQDHVDLEKAKKLFGDRLTVVGGTNALSLTSGDPARIRNETQRALDILGPTHHFILHPVDAIFPDTPWEGVEALIEAWKDYQ